MLGRIVGEDIELNTALRAERDDVLADPGQVHQVLMNLVVNARDAMPNGGRLILDTRNVDVRPEDVAEDKDTARGPYVLLQVTDTGIGMDQETCRQIFEPFFTTKEAGKGTGLGLSTVYGIVRQSGGFVRVDSELGRGTVFKVYLPLARADAPARISTPRPAHLHGSETILIVEDQNSVRALAAETLESYGYSVVKAANADEALAAVELLAEPIHLLLTDVVMPGLNGKMLAERLKSSRPGTRLLFMSGYTDKANGLVGVADSGLAYLQKPFAPETLAAKVREVLDAVRV
jgi:two-component system cell cycle sensor histidine kinase/response regulator CckA